MAADIGSSAGETTERGNALFHVHVVDVGVRLSRTLHGRMR
jgi:hypothetical protein